MLKHYISNGAIKIIAALLIWYIRIESERGAVRDEILGRRAGAAA